MSLINSAQNQMSIISNWVDSTPVPQMIDNITYDLYESNNPFRKKFNEEEITNKNLRIAANTSTAIGAEVFSVFANPFYLGHKIINIPVYYKNVVNSYQKNASGNYQK